MEEDKACRKEEGTTSAGIGIYIHIPFCVRKCLYCDFLSGAGDEDLISDYMKALVREIRISGEDGTRADTVFVGGGTPSIIHPSLLQKVFDELYRVFRVSPEAEITLEANPGTLSWEKLLSFRDMGINRLSIGAQSASDEELRRLGRIHTWKDFLTSWEMARKAGFGNMNLDLMSAIPGQTEESWEHTLHAAASLHPEHLSAYSLIVEEGTPFASMDLDLPDEDAEYRMAENTADILAGYGLQRYEISNYAADGRQCRHNTAYWTGKDYIGFGLGASSLRHSCRYRVTPDMNRYLAMGEDRKAILTERTPLSIKDRIEEFMFLGLRMTEGVGKKEFQERFHRPMEALYGEVIRKYRDFGLLEEKGDRLLLTRHGIHVSNQVMAEFLLDSIETEGEL